jgi:hypothetical protein
MRLRGSALRRATKSNTVDSDTLTVISMMPCLQSDLKRIVQTDHQGDALYIECDVGCHYLVENFNSTGTKTFLTLGRCIPNV